MFFSINQSAQLNFSHYWHLGTKVVSTDAGWQQKQFDKFTVLYKGYADSAPLVDVVERVALEKEPSLLGNFCVIVYWHDTHTLEIKSDLYRSFPIHYTTNAVTNLVPLGQTAWTNNLVTIDADFNVNVKKFTLIKNFVDAESTVADIDQLLANKIQLWANNNSGPVKVFLSGGVDTLLVFSYIKRLNIPYEHVWGLHVDYDDFWLANSGDITKYWAYEQIHHWTTPSILASGAPGDEFMLRSPATANQYLKHYSTSILDLLNSEQEYLHREYFLREKHRTLFARQAENPITYGSTAELNWNLCNNVVNDWQHWHIGNTLTWTPLRDLELFKLFLRLPFDLAQGQIMNSTVSKQLIEQNVPGLTKAISDQKNTNNALRNLRFLKT